MRIKNQSGFGAVEFIVAVLVIAVGAFVVYTLVDRSDDDDDDTNNSSNTTSQSEDGNFSMTLTNLESLDQGVYEGWVVSGEDKTSFGSFNIDSDGEIDGDLSYDDVTPADGDSVVITIEPDNDSDPAPSATVILKGDVADGSATLAFPVDVSAFSGQYILGTPTTATTDDETAGIWFTQTGSDTLLDLPVLAADSGWIYEGWVVYDGTPLTSGQFADPSKGDLFNGYSGPGNAPAKPGEDYIQNLPGDLTGPLDLANGSSKVVVSLEPYQNGADPTGSGPAQVKPLSADIGEGVADHSAFDLTVSTDSVPSGSVSVK